MNNDAAELNNKLKEIAGHRPLVILGVGSELRGDDAWPFHLINAFKGLSLPQVSFIWGSTLPESYIKPIVKTKPSAVLVCDSAHLDVKPGALRFFDTADIAPEGPLSHRMSLRSLALMLEALSAEAENSLNGLINTLKSLLK